MLNFEAVGLSGGAPVPRPAPRPAPRPVPRPAPAPTPAPGIAGWIAANAAAIEAIIGRTLTAADIVRITALAPTSGVRLIPAVAAAWLKPRTTSSPYVGGMAPPVTAAPTLRAAGSQSVAAPLPMPSIVRANMPRRVVLPPRAIPAPGPAPLPSTPPIWAGPIVAPPVGPPAAARVFGRGDDDEMDFRDRRNLIRQRIAQRAAAMQGQTPAVPVVPAPVVPPGPPQYGGPPLPVGAGGGAGGGGGYTPDFESTGAYDDYGAEGGGNDEQTQTAPDETGTPIPPDEANSDILDTPADNDVAPGGGGNDVATAADGLSGIWSDSFLYSFAAAVPGLGPILALRGVAKVADATSGRGMPNSSYGRDGVSPMPVPRSGVTGVIANVADTVATVDKWGMYLGAAAILGILYWKFGRRI